MSIPYWTPEEDAQLLRMRAEGMKFRPIGVALGRTEAAALDRHRLIREPGSHVRKKVLEIPEVKAFAIEALRDASPEKVSVLIAEKFGLSVHCCTIRAFRHRLPPVAAPEPFVPRIVFRDEIRFAEWVIRKTPGEHGVSVAKSMVPA